MLIHFIAFDLPHKFYCGLDHLTIEDGDGTTLMRKGCGSTSSGNVDVADSATWGSLLPPNITSTSNTVKLIFKTDEDDTGSRSGWSLAWRAVEPGWSQQRVHL